MPRYRYYVELSGTEPVRVHETRTAAAVRRVAVANPDANPATVVFTGGRGSDAARVAAVVAPAGDTVSVDLPAPATGRDIYVALAAAPGTPVIVMVEIEDGQ